MATHQTGEREYPVEPVSVQTLTWATLPLIMAALVLDSWNAGYRRLTAAIAAMCVAACVFCWVKFN